MNDVRGSAGNAVIAELQRLFRDGTVTGSTEGELLQRFVARRDETAFEAIVARHGPMVLSVCRQLLRDPNDVDDAFQATFLVLIRKAGSVRQCDLLGNWLYGVAYRVAARARCLAARRARQAAAAIAAAQSEARQHSGFEAEIPHFGLAQQEPEPWLHQEIARLPEKYRAPIVLCYMEGLTHDDAARRLQCPLGTVKGRLARARDLLRKRLTRRGLAMSETSFATFLCGADSKAAVPVALVQATVQSARSISARAGFSLAACSSVSPSVAVLGEGVLQAMTIAQVKTFALPLFLVGAVAAGVVALGAQGDPKKKKGGSSGQPRSRLLDRQKVSQVQPAPQPGPKSAPQVLREQLTADEELFSSLVVPGRSWSADDVRALVRWSLRLLEASRSISADPQARRAAYTAHRDRLKRLVEQVAKSSLSHDITLMTISQLKEAEALLELPPAEGHQPEFKVDSPAGRPGAGITQGLPSQGSVSRARAPVPEARPSVSSQPQGQAGLPAETAGMMSGMGRGGRGMGGGGGMGAMAGMMGGMPAGARAIRLRQNIAASAAEMALRSTNPRSRIVHQKLDEFISMSFANPTPLEDILKYIKQATTSPTFIGIPIYVDPKGLEETNTTLKSPVSIDLEGIPLKTTLRLLLKQLGLAYCVHDGVLIISSVEGIAQELAEEHGELDAASEATDKDLQ